MLQLDISNNYQKFRDLAGLYERKAFAYAIQAEEPCHLIATNTQLVVEKGEWMVMDRSGLKIVSDKIFRDVFKPAEVSTEQERQLRLIGPGLG